VKGGGILPIYEASRLGIGKQAQCPLAMADERDAAAPGEA
jgi:hypothetical protein